MTAQTDDVPNFVLSWFLNSLRNILTDGKNNNVYVCQVLYLVESNMQSQVRYEYNNTALPRNVTNSSVLRTTAFWDAMQIKVFHRHRS